MKHLFLVFAYLYASVSLLRADIVVSIKPLYGLVAKVIGETDHKVDLLYDGSKSPHTTGLTIDAVLRIKKADLVFWAGAIYETASAKHLNDEPNAIDLSKSQNLMFLSYRTFDGKKPSHCCHGDDDEHDHDHNTHEHNEHPHHDHGDHSIDGHYWLDVNNAVILLKDICAALCKRFPSDRSQFEKNTLVVTEKLRVFGQSLKAKMKEVHYISFHDFTQYFDHYFGTKCVGTIVADPHHGISVKHLTNIMGQLQNGTVAFVIAEKQFRADILKKLEDSGATIKSLDYLGADLNPNDFVYERILEQLVDGFIS